MATREYVKPVFHCCWHSLFEKQGYVRQFSFQIVNSAELAILALAIYWLEVAIVRACEPKPFSTSRSHFLRAPKVPAKNIQIWT